MNRETEIKHIVNDIQKLLGQLESTFWNTFVAPDYYDGEPRNKRDEIDERDNRTWLFRGTKELYFKICLFLELKDVPLYLKLFMTKFSERINDEKLTLKSHGGFYNDSEPSMIIHDEFREYLSAFYEFDNDKLKIKNNKLKLILENTNSILAKTSTTVTNETSIYKSIRWFVEIIYPSTRGSGKARFIQKFSRYEPDILIPEISSAVEYKYIRKNQNPEAFITQIKTDADNYKGDHEYRFFYAVVVFQDKNDLNQAAFKQAVKEKGFPENWTILAL